MPTVRLHGGPTLNYREWGRPDAAVVLLLHGLTSSSLGWRNVAPALADSFRVIAPDARVVDLYAGSGAIGIEALSRGAGAATFVEADGRAVATLRDNLRRTGLAEDATVVGMQVEAFLGGTELGPWDLAVLDPPYETRAIVAPLRALVPHLAPGASVVIKHFWRTEPPEVEGLAVVRQRRFGETMLTFIELETA